MATATISALVGDLENRLSKAQQTICDFQAAAMLGTPDDPDGITPQHVENEITSLREELAAARKDCAELAKLKRLEKEFNEYLKSLAESIDVDMEEFGLPSAHGNDRLRWAVMISEKIGRIKILADGMARIIARDAIPTSDSKSDPHWESVAAIEDGETIGYQVRWSEPGEGGGYLYVGHYLAGGDADLSLGWCANAAGSDAKRKNEEGKLPSESAAWKPCPAPNVMPATPTGLYSEKVSAAEWKICERSDNRKVATFYDAKEAIDYMAMRGSPDDPIHVKALKLVRMLIEKVEATLPGSLPNPGGPGPWAEELMVFCIQAIRSERALPEWVGPVAPVAPVAPARRLLHQ